jgi:hypothetical protein
MGNFNPTTMGVDVGAWVGLGGAVLVGAGLVAVGAGLVAVGAILVGVGLTRVAVAAWVGVAVTPPRAAQVRVADFLSFAAFTLKEVVHVTVRLEPGSMATLAELGCAWLCCHAPKRSRVASARLRNQ